MMTIIEAHQRLRRVGFCSPRRSAVYNGPATLFSRLKSNPLTCVCQYILRGNDAASERKEFPASTNEVVQIWTLINTRYEMQSGDVLPE
jgi:hypothetical protein